MARREREVPQMVAKEIYDHFKPDEIELIAAYCYGFDGIWPYQGQKLNAEKGIIEYKENQLPPFREDQHHSRRPWTTFERFTRAICAISRVMDEHPTQNISWAIANINANGTVESGNFQLEPKDVERSKEIYKQIIGSGFAWGDEKALKGYVDGFGGSICKKLGFKPVEAPAFKSEFGDITSLRRTNIEDMRGEKPQRGNLVPTEELKAPTEG